MNFRELNEKMQAFLEISAETRQRVVDARREQAQKAMDKYAKTQSLADRHAKLDFSKPLRVVTEIDTVTHVSELIPEDKIEKATELGLVEDGFLVIPVGTLIHIVREEGYNLIFTIDGLDAEIGLPQKWVIKNVKSEEESTQDFEMFEVDEETKKAILDGTFVVPVGHTLAEYIVPAIKEEMITDAELDAIIKNNRKMDRGQNSLFPSCWNEDELGIFPAQLMEAITRSDNAENLLDIYNIYYHRRSFLQPEALGVLSDAIIANVDKEAKELSKAYDGAEEVLQDIIEVTARYAPEAMEALKAKLEGIITA